MFMGKKPIARLLEVETSPREAEILSHRYLERKDRLEVVPPKATETGVSQIEIPKGRLQ
jgi:hypothetical protein